MISNMEKEKKLGLMGLVILAITIGARSKGLGSSFGLMGVDMKASSMKIILKGRGSTGGETGGSSMGSGRLTK